MNRVSLSERKRCAAVYQTASMLAARGAFLLEIADALGHKTLAMVKRLGIPAECDSPCGAMRGKPPRSLSMRTRHLIRRHLRCRSVQSVQRQHVGVVARV
jgi:hypothetical protein